MANTIKGFMQIPSLANNNPDSVATIGELSMTSRTYAREKQYVALDSEPGCQLVVFKAVDSSDVDITALTGTYCEAALSIVNLIRNNFDNSVELATYLSNNIDTNVYTAISYGPIVSQDGVYLPEYIQFTHTDNGGTTFKIWCSDGAFQTDWDESETYVLPPVADITSMYQEYASSLEAINAYTIDLRIAGINAITNKFPATEQTTYTLKWQDPSDVSLNFITTWTVLGHGTDSVRTDKVLQAIRDYLTANTAYTEDEWKEYFPDIETLDVFSIVPLWDSIALSAGATGESVMRPVFRIAELPAVITNMLVGRTEDEFSVLGEAFTLLYKNMPVLSMPSTSNDVSNQSFVSLFPDYTIAVLNTQTGTALAATTQAIISALDSLVRAAEVDTGSETLPSGITRNLINEVNFLEKSVNNIVYRMVTKASYDARI